MGCDVMFTGDNAVQSNRIPAKVRRAPSGWRVGIYPRTVDLPILSRCEVVDVDQHEALATAKHRVDGVIPIRCVTARAVASTSAACFP
jgi:hypothetical protein